MGVLGVVYTGSDGADVIWGGRGYEVEYTVSFQVTGTDDYQILAAEIQQVSGEVSSGGTLMERVTFVADTTWTYLEEVISSNNVTIAGEGSNTVVVDYSKDNIVLAGQGITEITTTITHKWRGKWNKSCCFWFFITREIQTEMVLLIT